MQEFFEYNGKRKWTEDFPKRVLHECGGYAKAPIRFLALVGQMGSTGMKTHLGSAYVHEYDDGTMKLDSVRTGCAAGTASRGGCSESRPAHHFETTGIVETTCKNSHCKKANGMNLDNENKTAWIELRTFYGIAPHYYHV
jgi:hypothetical protein